MATANRLTVTVTASLVHPGGSASLQVSEQRTLAGTGFVNIEQEIGTSWEAVSVTDIGTLGFLFIRNEDAVNYVEIATANDNTGIFGKIVAGRGLPVDVSAGATYYLKANTATVKVVILATEA
jgi:hypothetical protein